MPEPPLLPVAPPPLLPRRRPIGLIAATLAIGLLQLVLGLSASRLGPGADNIGYRIGSILGGLALWPLIIIGLFSIAPRFRTTRTRLVILLVVWGLFSLGHLGNLGKSQPRSTVPQRDHPQSEVAGNVPGPETAASVPPPIESVPDLGARPAAYDLSPGSDARLVRLIEGAQTERYHAVLDDYARACAARPLDAVLALERVKFIDHFAYSEESPVEGAEKDRETALAHLTGRFPLEPGTVLYLLRQEYGDELEARAVGYENLVTTWTPSQHAEFLLLRANAAEATNSPRVLDHVRKSFHLHATAEAGILLAEKAHAAGLEAEALAAVANPVFDQADPWLKKRKMALLFATKQHTPAFELYEELKRDAPHSVQHAETAGHLAEAGRIAAARELLAGLTVNDWNRESVLRSRYDFELQHGDGPKAAAAYRELRATGFAADPFLRERFALLLRYPGADWEWDDLAGAGLLGLLLVMVAFSPLVLLIPIHYWSLLRVRNGKASAWTGTLWGLRQAWLVGALMLLAEVVALWLWHPELMRSWLSDVEATVPATDRILLWHQLMSWTAIGATLLVMLWRVRGWRVLGPGEWSVGQSLGIGFGVAVGLRIGLHLYTLIVPGIVENDAASFSPQTQQLCLALLRETGPFGLLGAIAVLVPLLEELLFRGVLLQALARHIPFGWANAVQALLFALVHEEYRLIPFYFAFGIACGLLARRSGGLLAALIVHACNNFLVGVGIILLQQHP